MRFPKGTSTRLQWFLCVPIALAPATAFAGLAALSSHFFPHYLPAVAARELGYLLGPAIAIVLAAEYAPDKKLTAAWILALLNAASALITIVITSRLPAGFVRDVFGSPLYFLYVSTVTISGSVLGMLAARQDVHALNNLEAAEEVEP